MTDLSKTIAPKSDQLNADDLISGPITITVTGVSLLAGEQPIGINFEGDGGKPYKPCKSMRRVLVTLWGRDGNAYVGRKMTIFRDEKVQFGGAAVGGIRISHMSHITEDRTMALTATRASRKPYTVRPLVEAQVKPLTAAEKEQLEKDAAAEACKGIKALRAWWSTLSGEGAIHMKPQAAKFKAMAEESDKLAAGAPDGITASTQPPADQTASGGQNLAPAVDQNNVI